MGTASPLGSLIILNEVCNVLKPEMLTEPVMSSPRKSRENPSSTICSFATAGFTEEPAFIKKVCSRVTPFFTTPGI